MVPSMLKTGFDVVDDEPVELDQGMMLNVRALLTMFTEDAIRTAGKYAIASSRNVVDDEDMRRALKYVARTFFEHPDMESRFAVARRECEEEESESEDSGDNADDSDDADAIALENPTARENPFASADDAAEFCKKIEECTATWDAWEPTDPVHALVKRAIDNTPCEGRE